MNSITSIGLSGLAAAQARLGSAAHNVANAASPGFHRQTVVAEARAEGGVSFHFGRDAAAGADLAADLVAQRQAVYDFKANLRTLQAADAMTGALLDALA